MKKNYINISLYVLEEDFDSVAAMVSLFPITGIEEKLDQIIISFKEEEYNENLKDELINYLKQSFDYIKIKTIEKIEDENWNAEWEKNVPIVHVSDRIAIAPEWRKDEINKEINLIINPKMSFGTGQHATTKLVAQMMETCVKPGDKWIDAGTGTGVLAVLASKLGAKDILAFDNDEWSVDNTLENCILNKVENEIDVQLINIDTYELPKANGIAANLFLHLINNNLKKFYEALKDNKGDLLVSGILSYNETEIVKNAENCGFETIRLLHEDEWTGFHFRVK